LPKAMGRYNEPIDRRKPADFVIFKTILRYFFGATA